MTTFLLIRHGETDAVGRSLAGWKTGCHLNKTGKQQVRALEQALAGVMMKAIYTSPLDRAVETAAIIAEPRRLSPVVREQLGELHFGAWEGRTFDELSRDPSWVQ